MSFSVYDITVPVFVRQLKNLSAFLEKSEKWCTENNKSLAYLLESRLFPDMHPLPFQIRVCTNMARNGVLNASWAFVSSVSPDDEHDFEGLHARIQRTLDFLATVKREDVEGRDMKPMSFWTGGAEGKGLHLRFDSGRQMLLNFVLPNFWFHMTTAYDLCRTQGVDLGKRHFIAAGFLDRGDLSEALKDSP